MRKVWALCVLAAFAGSALAAEFPLEPKQINKELAQAGLGGSGAFAQLRTQKIASIKKEPKATSQRPLYGTLTNDGSETGLVFRLDESAGTGKGYDRLIFDANGNGDLTDDAVCKAEKKQGDSSGQYESARFGPMEVGAKQGIWQPMLFAETYIFDRRLIAAAGQSAAYIGQLRVMAGSCLETTLDLDGVKQKIAVHDANCNLRLGEPARVIIYTALEGQMLQVQGGDLILRARNGSGEFEPDAGNTESEPFAKILYIGGNPYTLKLAKDLKAVTLEPYSGPTGELTAEKSSRIGRAVLARKGSNNQWEALTPDLSSGKAKAPVGEYRIASCNVIGEDAKGATIIAAAVSAGSKDEIAVSESQPATLRCGAPIEVKVEAQVQSGGASGFLGSLLGGGDRTVNISAKMTGAGGEAYRSFSKSSKSGRETLNPPKFKVQTLDGKELASGQLEYG